MPLTTYADAQENARRIVVETKARKMPPWLPDTSECAPLRHSRSMSLQDIDALAEWAASGAPEGDPADHHSTSRRKTFEEVKGAPELVISPGVAYIPKRGRADDYHCFVIDPKLERNERVTALRVVPGEPAIVHHVALFEARGSALEKVPPPKNDGSGVPFVPYDDDDEDSEQEACQ